MTIQGITAVGEDMMNLFENGCMNKLFDYVKNIFDEYRAEVYDAHNWKYRVSLDDWIRITGFDRPEKGVFKKLKNGGLFVHYYMDGGFVDEGSPDLYMYLYSDIATG